MHVHYLLSNFRQLDQFSTSEFFRKLLIVVLRLTSIRFISCLPIRDR